MEELREKLKTEIDQTDWNALKIHHENGAVFIVDDKLELIDVGVAIAMDKLDFVKIWLDNDQLKRPTEEQVEQFNQNEYEKLADFLIIQPYVLIKLLK